MMSIFLKIASFTALSSALVACGLNNQANVGTGTGTDSAAPSLVSNKAASGPTAQTWITAQQKHNNSGINLRYRLMSKPQPGQALEVQLEFSGVTQDNAGVTIRSDKALALAESAMPSMKKSSSGYQMSLSKAQATQQSLSVTPAENGMHYIDLVLGQGDRQSVVTIAVAVGDGPFATPTTGEIKTLPSGEKIIEMRSQ